jgi:glyoxylase-like metal-dependent hydrolase (beta-lactamase superfamily II)
MNELEPGRLVRAARGVQRLLAPNPSLMTGPGTNTYLLGDPPVAVIDPGPPDATHLAVLERVAPQLALIFLTHTHPDHAAGARRLAQRTGARIVGRPGPNDGRQAADAHPDLIPERDQRFELAGAALRAIDTPGHASNHVCYLLESERLLFSGDHILDGVTPVILAPDGEMAAYLTSLERLRQYRARAIAPGHGRVLDDPDAAIDGIIAHRRRREAKVLRALERAGHGRVDELLGEVYDDVPVQLHALARLTLTAHLIKLEQDGACRCEGDAWYRLTSKPS